MTEPMTLAPVRVLDLSQMAAVRGVVGQLAQDAGLCDERVHDTLLVLCELVTNALRYGGPDVEVSAVVSEGAVVLAVADASPVSPQLTTEMPPADTIGGRGIPLCAALATRLWVDLRGPGKILYAEVS